VEGVALRQSHLEEAQIWAELLPLLDLKGARKSPTGCASCSSAVTE
jgi:hypothetical protein